MFKLYLPFIISLLCISNFVSQQDVLSVAEKMPLFGNSKTHEESKIAAQDFITKTVSDKKILLKQEITNLLITVGIDGKVSKVITLKSSSNPQLDEVILNMPNWTPGQNGGKNVAVQFTITVKKPSVDSSVSLSDTKTSSTTQLTKNQAQIQEEYFSSTKTPPNKIYAALVSDKLAKTKNTVISVYHPDYLGLKVGHKIKSVKAWKNIDNALYKSTYQMYYEETFSDGSKIYKELPCFMMLERQITDTSFIDVSDSFEMDFKPSLIEYLKTAPNLVSLEHDKLNKNSHLTLHYKGLEDNSGLGCSESISHVIIVGITDLYIITFTYNPEMTPEINAVFEYILSNIEFDR